MKGDISSHEEDNASPRLTVWLTRRDGWIVWVSSSPVSLRIAQNATEVVRAISELTPEGYYLFEVLRQGLSPALYLLRELEGAMKSTVEAKRRALERDEETLARMQGLFSRVAF